MKLEKTANGVKQYYGIGAVMALRVKGGLGYYIYQTKKGGQGKEQSSSNPQQNDPPRLTSLRWIKSLLYYKNGQEEYSK